MAIRVSTNEKCPDCGAQIEYVRDVFDTYDRTMHTQACLREAGE
jgi:hypothetical protein